MNTENRSPLFLGLHTTTLFPHNGEILDIAIIDASGALLVDSYVRPYWNVDWQETTQKFGVTPEDVATAPFIHTLVPAIQATIADQQLVLFNAPIAGCSPGLARVLAGAIECAMREFALVYGDWNPQKSRCQWSSLTAAARQARFDWPKERRRAHHDALAVRAIWGFLESTLTPEQRQLHHVAWMPSAIVDPFDARESAVAS